MTAPTVAMLRVWLRERAGRRDEPLFPTRTGRRLSDDAVERRVATYRCFVGIGKGAGQGLVGPWWRQSICAGGGAGSAYQCPASTNQRYKANAGQRCPSLHTKKLTPHVLRHTSAMSLLHEGVGVAVIALWLGHADIRSTDAYLHADLTIKERALARTTPISSKPGRYRPPDSLLAFLESP